jgi:hypothetical protein
MKKITLMLAVLLTGIMADAQVLLSENFDTALNWTVAHTLTFYSCRMDKSYRRSESYLFPICRRWYGPIQFL